MTEQAIYHSEDGKWYRAGEEPWQVRVVPPGAKLMPLFSVTVDTMFEAFGKLYGHYPVIPPVVRAVRPGGAQ